MQDQPSGLISPQSPTPMGPDPEATTADNAALSQPQPEAPAPMSVAPTQPEVSIQPTPMAAPTQPSWMSATPQVSPVGMAPTPQEPTPTMPAPAMPPQKKGFFASKKARLFGLVIPLVLLIGGGGAYGYYAYVYMPNQPDNIVFAALADLATRKEMTVDTKTDYTPKNGGQAVSLDMKLQANTANSQLAASGTLGVSGAQFPYDVRYVEKNLYLKVGGLDGIGSLVGEEASAYSQVLNAINDQWYVVDRSLWDSMGEGVGCITDVPFVFTDDDMAMIKSAYLKHPLFKVTSSSSETVDGTATTKYMVDPTTDEEASAFAAELNDLSIVKKIKDCLPDESEQGFDEEITDFKDEADTALSGTLAIYVTDDKQVKKIELTSEDDEASMTMSGVFGYDSVNVVAPTGAKPAQELIMTLYGGYSLGWNMGGIEGSLRDTERKNDIALLQAKLETYSAENNGKYPLTGKLSQAGFTDDELTGPAGDEYVYQSDGRSYTLTAQLESAPQESSVYSVSGGR